MLAASSLAVALPNPATAAPADELTFVVQGTLSDVGGFGSTFAVGDPFTLTYVVDPTLPPTSQSSLYANYSVSSVTVEVGSYSSVGSGDPGYTQLQVVNDAFACSSFCGPRDSHSLNARVTGAGVEGFEAEEVVLGAADNTGAVFSDTSLPLVAPDLGDFTSLFFNVKFAELGCVGSSGEDVQRRYLSGTVTSWTLGTPGLPSTFSEPSSDPPVEAPPAAPELAPAAALAPGEQAFVIEATVSEADSSFSSVIAVGDPVTVTYVVDVDGPPNYSTDVQSTYPLTQFTVEAGSYQATEFDPEPGDEWPAANLSVARYGSHEVNLSSGLTGADLEGARIDHLESGLYDSTGTALADLSVPAPPDLGAFGSAWVALVFSKCGERLYVIADIDSWSVAPGGATDQDGVDDAVENGGPNSGDGNGDGTPDAEQTNVTSLPGTSGYVTVAAPAGYDLAAVTTTDAGLAPPGLVDQSDAIGYTVTLPVGQSTAVIELYLDDPPPTLNTFYKVQGATWIDATSLAAFQALGGDRTKVTLTLTDGAFGDADGVANGQIVDPGVAAYNPPPSVDAGGPYSVVEGGSVTLAAVGTDPGDALTYEWDLDGDSVYETTGAEALFDAAVLVAPAVATVSVRVTDAHGSSTSATATIQVLFPFVGTSPAFATMDQAKAGSAVPVRFTVGGPRPAGALVGPPTVVPVDCVTHEPLGTGDAASTPSSPVYIRMLGSYVFVWKTSRAMADTCQSFQVALSDGSVHTAWFTLK